jgi:hypothetical protein
VLLNTLRKKQIGCMSMQYGCRLGTQLPCFENIFIVTSTLRNGKMFTDTVIWCFMFSYTICQKISSGKINMWNKCIFEGLVNNFYLWFCPVILITGHQYILIVFCWREFVNFLSPYFSKSQVKYSKLTLREVDRTESKKHLPDLTKQSVWHHWIISTTVCSRQSIC